MYKFLLYLLISLLVFFGLFSLFIWYAIQPGLPEEEFPLSSIKQYEPITDKIETKEVDQLRVITYNMGYASGKKNNKGNILKREEVEENLNKMAEALEKLKPDILLIQEVDFFSRRSFDINQLEFLAKRLQMPYGAYLVNWNKKYVAWPLWKPLSHFRRIVSGQAILSRYPILDQKHLVLEKPKKNPFWFNWFYIDRAVQIVKMKVGERIFSLYNVHLEAFDKKERSQQIKILSDWINRDPSPYKILGGDFNHPWREIKYSPKKLMKSKEALIEFQKDTNLRLAGSDLEFLSFPSWKPHEWIDFIFYTDNLTFKEADSVKELKSSDHLPVWAKFRL